jgi:serine/threonine protein kinase
MATSYGSYTLGDELGRGGMGVVYKARHNVLGKPACVKLLLPEFTRHAEVVTRFVNEAKAAASLDHPNIVDVLDCNQAPDGVWFIVLEFLEGMPLSKWLARQGAPVAPATACRILVQAANALHTAHDHVSETVAGIVHRDVKPDNIFLVARHVGKRTNDLHVVLHDFGIAKLLEHHAEGMTRTGATIGTPAYMAPEQLANSKVVDRRADVYALGVVLYELLTGGWRPWSDANNETPAPSEIYRRQTCEAPPDPRQRNPALSAGLAYVVRRALACDPRERWPSAAEFARALAEAVPADGINPSGAELLRVYAEELWDPNDPMLGQRLAVPPISAVDEGLWRPPVSAISIITSSNGIGIRAAGDVQGTRDLRPQMPPPGAVPSTTLGASAAQSVPGAMSQRRSRVPLFAVLGGVVVAGGVAVALLASDGTNDKRGPGATAGESPAAAALIDAAPSHLTSVAVLTDPVGAAVFVDDELVGTSPTKVELAAGRRVRVRAELSGFPSTESEHVVGDRAETVRLTFTAQVEAAVAVDAGADAAATARGRSRSRGTPRGKEVGSASGSGSAKATGGFDPENIAQ